MIDWRERLREVDRRVNRRAGTFVLAPIISAAFIVFFMWAFGLLDGDDE